ncbi:hypothetical protein BB934_45710 (plasmid) [Microvirga ossetica]|uniref:Uncharacterized protein n=1 Tax=Microvirga ossetica TaxID=1882682 RepID=A0A1B2F008_9HYPH|nr:hypothetical protein [Microvirga ossetica]ANY85518.1 hypothetical protein BB934_45710 [Microvirga ossetica]
MTDTANTDLEVLNAEWGDVDGTRKDDGPTGDDYVKQFVPAKEERKPYTEDDYHAFAEAITGAERGAFKIRSRNRIIRILSVLLTVSILGNVAAVVAYALG